MVHETANLSPRRQRKRDAKIEQILDTAMLLVVEGGLEMLTVHRLADRLDLTPGALYRYFPSMAAVLIALETRVIESYGTMFRNCVVVCRHYADEQSLDPGVSSLLHIMALAEQYRSFVHHRPAELSLTSHMLADPRVLVDDDTAVLGVEPMLQILFDVAERMTKAASVTALNPGDGLERALIFWSGLQGVLQLRKLERFAPGDLTFDRLAMEITRVMLRGWGASETTLSAAEQALEHLTRDRPLIEIVENTLSQSTTTGTASKPTPD